MKRAFSLIELLLVIAIMAIMGTVAVGGYRAMQRGMDERGTMVNVNAFISLAYRRAQIDRLPAVVYFWNETVQGESGDNNTLRVVGKAVAVRRGGRITDVQGSYLLDEFADLDFTYSTDGSDSKSTMPLYPMDDIGNLSSGSTIKRSLVRTAVSEYKNLNPMYLSGTGGSLPTEGECNPPNGKADEAGYGDNIRGDSPDGGLSTYAFYVEDKGGVTWKRGMAYGFEFARIQLPIGFIFGNQYSMSTSSPIRNAGILVFKPGLNSGSGAESGKVGSSTIEVYELLPDSSGMLSATSVGRSEDPSKESF